MDENLYGENIILKKDKMCLATAMAVLHEVYGIFCKNGVTAPALALETVFCFVDEILFLTCTDLGGDDVEENLPQNNASPEVRKSCRDPYDRIV